MKIRLLEIEKDFSVIKGWITDERLHAMWCANLMQYLSFMLGGNL